ncbi:hypothetical protein GC176_16955 [bacterium]|nr:hypothetical protein [bacterium]
MSRRKHGQFATFAMLIPMFAVPVMAVFGIPQFAPVVASPASEDHPDWLSDRSFNQVGQSDAFLSRRLELPTAASEQLDLFQPFPAEGRPTPAAMQQLAAAERRTALRPSDRSARQTGIADAATENSRVVDLFEPVKNAAEQEQATSPVRADVSDRTVALTASGSSTEQPANRGYEQQLLPRVATVASAETALPVQQRSSRNHPAAPSEGLSWRGAVNRLNQLGIRTYRLNPAAVEGRYHFMCLVTSADDPRISRRFEAESREPLDAVDRVLAQVEEWNRIR